MSIKKFANDWAVRYLPRDVDFAATMGLPMGNSATYAKTRAEGGLSADVADLLELEPYLEPEVQDGMPPGQGALVNEIRVVGAAYADEWHAYPKGRVAIIRERGHKVRIVTAMSRHALVLGHLARRRLEKGLRKWSLTRHVYEGEPREVGREFVGSTGRVVSSDLRAASDLIPLDVARAIVDGFEESDRFLPCELDGLRLGTGPVEVTWPNGETHVTNRGLLMGLPTTWSMLCVYHGWAWQQAQSCPLNPRGAKGITARICGDDLLGVAPPAAIRAYESALLASGAQFSAGKHFNSPNRGVFLEVLWEFKGTAVSALDGNYPIWVTQRRGKGKRNRRRWAVNTVRLLKVARAVPNLAMPLRGMVVGDTPFGHGAPEAPDWWLAGSTESSYSEHFPRRTVHAVARTLRPRLPSEFERVGIPPFLPRCLGGAGLVSPVPSPRIPTTHAKSLASLLYGQTIHLTSYERVWAAVVPKAWRAIAESDVYELLFGTHRVLRRGQLPPTDWTSLGDPERVFENLVSAKARAFELMLGPDEDAVRYPPLREVGERLASVRGELLRRWKSASPVRKPLPELVSQWKEVRNSLLMWVPTFLPDVEYAPTTTVYNELMVEGPNLPFFKTWRRFAIASVSREDRWWSDKLFHRLGPVSTYAAPVKG
jgi:hypothetical protein